jgi:hypothetical protein
MKTFFILFLSLFALACLPSGSAQVDGCKLWKTVGYNNVFTCPGSNFGTFTRIKAIKAAKSWQACATACAKLDSKGCKAYSFSGPKKSCTVSFAEPVLSSLIKASGVTAGYLVDTEDK